MGSGGHASDAKPLAIFVPFQKIANGAAEVADFAVLERPASDSEPCGPFVSFLTNPPVLSG